MTANDLLAHLRPTTLAQMIAEIINDHADEDTTGEFTFQTEAALAPRRQHASRQRPNPIQAQPRTHSDPALMRVATAASTPSLLHHVLVIRNESARANAS